MPSSVGMSSSVTSSSGGVGGSGGGWGLDFYDCVINNDLERLESLVERHKIDLDAKFTEVRKKNHLDLSPIHLVAYKVWTLVSSTVYAEWSSRHQRSQLAGFAGHEVSRAANVLLKK